MQSTEWQKKEDNYLVITLCKQAGNFVMHFRQATPWLLELSWSWIIHFKVHCIKNCNGLVHLYSSSLPSPIWDVPSFCSSLKHTLCKCHKFQTAQKALFTQLSGRGWLTHSAVLCSNYCMLRIWRERNNLGCFEKATCECSWRVLLRPEDIKVVKWTKKEYILFLGFV